MIDKGLEVMGSHGNPPFKEVHACVAAQACWVSRIFIILLVQGPCELHGMQGYVAILQEHSLRTGDDLLQ